MLWFIIKFIDSKTSVVLKGHCVTVHKDISSVSTCHFQLYCGDMIHFPHGWSLYRIKSLGDWIFWYAFIHNVEEIFTLSITGECSVFWEVYLNISLLNACFLFPFVKVSCKLHKLYISLHFLVSLLNSEVKMSSLTLWPVARIIEKNW
jgi:hypothetical protein